MAFLVTSNFKTEIDEKPTFDSGFLLDERHLIYSKDNTLDIVQYLNYIDLVRGIAQRSKKEGLLTLGFLPLIMPPSFFKDKLHRMIIPKLKIQYFPVKSQSFLGTNYAADFPDIWVSKLDAAKIVGKQPVAVTVRDVLGVTLGEDS